MLRVHLLQHPVSHSGPSNLHCLKAAILSTLHRGKILLGSPVYVCLPWCKFHCIQCNQHNVTVSGVSRAAALAKWYFLFRSHVSVLLKSGNPMPGMHSPLMPLLCGLALCECCGEYGTEGRCLVELVFLFHSKVIVEEHCLGSMKGISALDCITALNSVLVFFFLQN